MKIPKLFERKKLGCVRKDKILEKLFEMYDIEDERIKKHKPLSTEWLIVDGRRSAITDMIAFVKHGL